jgi:hypothetical protein
MVRVGELRKRKIKEADEKLNLVEEESFFRTILKKKDFFDYSLGGYYHRERWACTRRYY